MSKKLKMILSKVTVSAMVVAMTLSVSYFSGDNNVSAYTANTIQATKVGAVKTANVITVKSFDELKAAVASATAGQTIEIATNTLDCTSQLVLDKVNSGITIKAADGYSPVLDFTSFREAAKKASPKKTGDGYAGVRISGGNYTIQGITVENAYDNGMLIKPNYNSTIPAAKQVTGKPDDNKIINCAFNYNGDAGLQISGSNGLEEAGIHVRPSNNIVTGCVAYRNFDPLTKGGNADGFAAKLFLGTGNVFSHCVSAENSDDAWDSFAIEDSDVTYEYCVAYHNGDPTIFTGAYDKANGLQTDKDLTVGKCSGNGNGFKMGSGSSKYGAQTSGLRKMKNCLAFDNKSKGFDENNGTGTIDLVNGMAFGNKGGDYVLDLMKAGTFTNVQAFSVKSLKAPKGGNIAIVDAAKQKAIRAEVDAAIAKMRNEITAKKVPTAMNFSFWN
ncbi:right-handed parallel beta-helix repeat-containing protein [Clostridium sp. HBUAS56017]|uniref:right-handed parallel beta-helix repeat-containing protein n=1 Tax=Clostridium sp. HBUAS56017 TaxID=2571128 RepID=UPI001178C9CE|nr:right-handed parallel beta-helix repeat-containing protein [Clostridium sp. HBUAS56017]